MLLITASTDATQRGRFTRLHYTCAVAWVTESGLDIPEGVELRDALPEAVSMMILGTSDDELWANISSPCIRCGEGDRGDSAAGDHAKAD